jgi:hypothetical protein
LYFATEAGLQFLLPFGSSSRGFELHASGNKETLFATDARLLFPPPSRRAFDNSVALR